jgi:pimeloyl-ACP methyl ester carboxylesterase
MLATDVRGGVIPDCGHWVADEAPEFVAEALVKFFGAKN